VSEAESFGADDIQFRIRPYKNMAFQCIGCDGGKYTCKHCFNWCETHDCSLLNCGAHNHAELSGQSCVREAHYLDVSEAESFSAFEEENKDYSFKMSRECASCSKMMKDNELSGLALRRLGGVKLREDDAYYCRDCWDSFRKADPDWDAESFEAPQRRVDSYTQMYLDNKAYFDDYWYEHQEECLAEMGKHRGVSYLNALLREREGQNAIIWCRECGHKTEHPAGGCNCVEGLCIQCNREDDARGYRAESFAAEGGCVHHNYPMAGTPDLSFDNDGSVWYEIVCGNCGATAEGAFYPEEWGEEMYAWNDAESFSADSKFKRPYDGRHGFDPKRDNKGRYRRKLVIPLAKGAESFESESLVEEPDWIPAGDGRALGQQNLDINLSPLHAEYGVVLDRDMYQEADIPDPIEGDDKEDVREKVEDMLLEEKWGYGEQDLDWIDDGHDGSVIGRIFPMAENYDAEGNLKDYNPITMLVLGIIGGIGIALGTQSLVK